MDLDKDLMAKAGGFSGQAKEAITKLRHHSNIAVITALEVPIMRYRILVRKLGFLHCVIKRNPVSLSGHVMLALCDVADW